MATEQSDLYSSSWASCELRGGMRDPHFKVMHQGEELSLVTRSSDGQMLLLETTAQRVLAQGGSGYARHRSPQVPTGV